MKTISTYRINYVVPDSEAEEKELKQIINNAQNEKFGIDFFESDLKLIKKTLKQPKGFYIKDTDTH
jgi:hypothetical protein